MSTPAWNGQPPLQTVRFVARLSAIDRLPHVAVALIVVQRRDGTIDRNLVKVWPAQTNQLRVEIRKQTPLKQRIVGEIDSGHNVAGMKSNLLSFGKEVIGIAIESQLADALHRNDLFGNDLGRIEQIEIEIVLVFFFDDLNAKLPFGIVAVLNRFPKIAAMKVGIFTGDLLRFVPDNRVQTEQRLPVKLHEARFASAR